MPSIPEKFSPEFFDVAWNYRRRCLKWSGQRLENVNWTHLVQLSGTLVLQKSLNRVVKCNNNLQHCFLQITSPTTRTSTAGFRFLRAGSSSTRRCPRGRSTSASGNDNEGDDEPDLVDRIINKQALHFTILPRNFPFAIQHHTTIVWRCIALFQQRANAYSKVLVS